MSSMSASSPDVCGVDVQALYLEDPGNKQEPAGFVLCSEMGNTCMKNGCSCRSASSATVNGTTKYFNVCVVLKSSADCVTSGDDYITCATDSDSSSGSAASSLNEAQNESNVASAISTMAPTTKATTESDSVASSRSSSSGSVDHVQVSSTATSSESMSMTVMVVIIVVAVIFVALVSWVVRAYCMRRSSAQSKLASRRNRSNRGTHFDATSPTNVSGRSSATPSFPAFDRRTRAMQSPTAGARGRAMQSPTADARGHGGRNTPRGREPNSGRGRRNPDVEFGPTGARAINREQGSGRGRRSPDMDFKPAGPRREPNSGRGRKAPDIDAQFAPNGPRRFGDAGMAPREPTSGRGRRTPDLQPRGNGPRGPEAAMRTPPRDQRAKQHTPVRAQVNNAAAPSGGTVFTGRNTYERVAQFAQLAAFEAPPPPPPRPQRPIQPVPVKDAIPKHARGPPPNARPTRPAPKRPGFHIAEDPLPQDYDILSPKTARSLAPSIASSATTVVAPGRNRPTPLQQGRRQQYSTATPSYYQSGFSREDNKYDESGFESKFAASSNYDDSFVSEMSSDMAWSGASGLSDDSYYHAAPSNTARIPVIEAPHDDDDDRSEDRYSDWGHSTQQSADVFRSTAGSDASFFSVNSDFTDSRSDFKEREF